MKRWVGAALLAAGCLHPNAEVCGDGRICPIGDECYETPAGEKLCLLPDQRTSCKPLEDGEACSTTPW